MKQLVHIHGGEAWDTDSEYISFLKRWEVATPFQDSIKGWKHNYEIKLGDEWQIIRPQMPSALNSKYNEWAVWFEKYIPYLLDGVVLVGHSLGANFLVKYITENDMPVKISQVHLVAGCYGWGGGFGLSKLVSDMDNKYEKIYIYHSKDDTSVPFSDAEKYKEALPSAQLITFTDRGHFLQPKFPELMNNILKV